jgi:hypothetical protein
MAEFPVRIVEWDEATERMANLAANNPEIAGEFTATAIEQLQALEGEADFALLKFDDLEASIRKELGVLETDAFAPLDEFDESQRLDERKKITCPSCGHEFENKA